jgi:paraquat-inducible protein B
VKCYEAGLSITASLDEKLDANVRSQVLRAVARKNTIFWVVKPVA